MCYRDSTRVFFKGRSACNRWNKGIFRILFYVLSTSCVENILEDTIFRVSPLPDVGRDAWSVDTALSGLGDGHINVSVDIVVCLWGWEFPLYRESPIFLRSIFSSCPSNLWTEMSKGVKLFYWNRQGRSYLLFLFFSCVSITLFSGKTS